MKINQSIVLIGMGIVNLLHASLHLFQFLQSALLFANSFSHSNEHSKIDEFMHNPFMTLVWGVIGILTLYIGIKDYRHHNKCNDKH